MFDGEVSIHVDIRLYLLTKCRKLKLEESQQLLQDLHSFFHNQPSHVREINSALRLKMVVWLNELSTLYASPAENKSERHKEIAREMAESIQSLFLFVSATSVHCTHLTLLIVEV